MDLRNHAFMVQTVGFSKVQIRWYIMYKKRFNEKIKIVWTEKTPIVYIKNKSVVYLTLL